MPTRQRSEARTEFLTYVLVTAVEGGINYWASVSGYHPEDADPSRIGVTVHDELSDDAYRVTLDTIAKGISVLKDKDKFPFAHRGYWLQFWLADRTNGDDGDYDAGIADCILQAGLFGEVVYG